MMLPTVARRPRLVEDISQGIRLARMQGREITPGAVAQILVDAGVPYVLVGAHAANGYTGRPRATADVDVVVRFARKAAKAIAKAYPDLAMEETAVAIRFSEGDQEAIDLLKSSSLRLWGRLLKDNREVRIGRQSIRVPALEGMLAAKFAAMISPGRRYADRLIDSGDFARMVENNPVIDLTLLRELGDLVYPRGGEEVVKLVADVRAGRKLEI